MTSYVTPKKNTAYVFYVSLEDAANPGKFKASPTLANGDVLVSTDDGAPGNMTTLPVVDADFTKRVKVSLSAGEMNGDNVTIIFSDAAGAEWYDLEVNLQTTARQIDDLGTSTYAGADTAGTTTLLARIIGTLATGTHNPQTGDAYAVVNHATYGNAQLARTGADSDTLKTLSDQLDLVGGGATTYSYSNTVDDGSGNLLDGVFVELATDDAMTNIVYSTHTNALGAFTVYDDTAGAHYLRMQLGGYSGTVQTVTLA